MKQNLSTFISIPVLAVLLSGCQDMNSAMTPNTKVLTDNFDGSKVIKQPPVSSSSSLAEAWHTLGFDWSSRTPDKIFVTVGVQGANNIFGLDFNVGGRIITASESSLTTEYGAWSSRRFSISYNDFEAVATSPTVKMKVSDANNYGVSSFGTATNALVNKKIPAFLQQVKFARIGQRS